MLNPYKTILYHIIS